MRLWNAPRWGRHGRARLQCSPRDARQIDNIQFNSRFVFPLSSIKGEHMHNTFRRFFALTLLSAALTGSTWANSHEKTLYMKLGGKKAITAVVDEFVARVAADRRINS